MKTRKELKKIKKRETERKNKIIAFLKENEGVYFTDEEVVEATGIKCAGSLLIDIRGLKEIYYHWYSPRTYTVGIEKIQIPDKERERYCGHLDYYGYRNTLDPSKRQQHK